MRRDGIRRRVEWKASRETRREEIVLVERWDEFSTVVGLTCLKTTKPNQVKP